MASHNSTTPTVRIARPSGRPLVIWYRDSDGKKIRKSTGSYDEQEAERQRRQLEARLVLDLPQTQAGAIAGPSMAWSDFREAYRTTKLTTMKARGAQDAEQCLDLAERIIRPRTLQDLADSLDRLQADLYHGKCGRYMIEVNGQKRPRPRSPATVRSTMRAVIAALNWAARTPRRWLENVPRIDLIRVDVSDEMKGRPLVGEELDRFYAAIPKVVGEARAEDWRFFVESIVAGGFRLSELVGMTWDRPQTIRPVFRRGALPEVKIPSHLQKNSRRETIPMTPWFAELLQQIPEHDRSGYVFQLRSSRPPYPRLGTDRVGKILTNIGTTAGIIVEEGDSRRGIKPKFASCHDLRRTFATRLAEAKVDPRIIQQIMRHSSIAVTERYYISTRTQQAAGELWHTLQQKSVGPRTDELASPLPHVTGEV